jgi:hypothetical protein
MRGKTRSPWGVWWLSLITLGIYYLVWYHQIHKEIAAAPGGTPSVAPVISQCIIIWNWVSVAQTGTQCADMQRAVGVPITSTAGMAFLSQFWISSQPRYLQRRLNTVWAAMDAAAVVPAAASTAVPVAETA